MSFFHLKNLSSGVITDSPAPWDSTAKRPDFADKNSYRTWCTAPSTDHYFYSGFEGLNQSARISKENPPYRMHVLVADYDSSTSRATALELIKKNTPVEFQPAWISSTFSGGVRLAWDFQEPVFCYNPAALKAFLTRLKLELKCAKLCPGLDEVLFKPEQLYELGTEWQQYSDTRIPKKILHLWSYQTGNRVKWSSEGTDIPIELVAAEAEKQFPGRWSGDFTEGARGCRFWDPTADNDTGAIVRSAGMQCFTGNTPFKPWASIFGAGFTRDFQANRVAAATDQIYFDGKGYWRKSDRGVWVCSNLDLTKRYLKVRCDLESAAGKANSSEVEQAAFHIEENNRVLAAVPFVHRNPGLHREPEGVYLNTSNVTVCPPADGTYEWGENFPWLAGFFDGFFTTPEQKDYFLAWLRLFYKSAYERNMVRGHAIFIAGPSSVGKSFLSTKIVPTMMGGAQEVSDYMMGRDSWNSSNFERPVWNIDDAHPSEDPKVHAAYCNNIKKHVANEAFNYQRKYVDAGRVHWSGRLIVTLNDEPEALGMLPEMENAIEDKVMFFLAAGRGYEFNDEETNEKRLKTELPFFCRHLLDNEPPDYVIDHCPRKGQRFGIKSYHNPVLLAAARERGKLHAFREILRTELVNYFRGEHEAQTWTGTSVDLLNLMRGGVTKELVRHYNTFTVGTNLGQLASREKQLVKQSPNRTGNKTLWIIGRNLVEGEADEQPGGK